jgi:TetR/AcrR family transcriptional repressor of mexJK operon
MSDKPGRPADPAKDRAILVAAHALLFESGPRAVTMEAVASRAEVSKVTVYRRFPNRQSLLEAVVQQEAVGIHRALLETPQTGADLQDQLTRFIESLVAFVCGPHHLRFMQALAELPQKKQDMARIYRNGPEETHRVLAEYLGQARRRGLIDCPQPHESAEMLLGLALGLDLVRALYRVALDRQRPESSHLHAQRVVGAFLRLHSGG